jgi:hypothetical protein
MLPPYARAFRRRGIEVHFLDWSVPLDTGLDALLSRFPFTPDYLFFPECAFPLLPDGIAHSGIPTIRLDVDSFAFTRRRIRWASLFDHVAVCHPGFDTLLKEKISHPGTLVLPHAVDRELLESPNETREFEVGWVGSVTGPIYRTREACLPGLAAEFRTNDWSRKYSLEEVADVYLHSRIVVNIARDDFPSDANLRAFEAMAAGALLLTRIPSELTKLGFVPGVHFVAYSEPPEIANLVRHYLNDEEARLRISRQGREYTLRHHTYDSRVDTLLKHLGAFGRQKLAPASTWPEARARLMQLDFYSGNGVLPCAKSQFRHIAASRSARNTIEAAALLGVAWVRHHRLKLRR